MNAPIRLVGLGSFQGDDAIAWTLVDQLEPRLRDRAGLELHKIEGSANLLDLCDGDGSLVILDAAVGHGPVGSWLRLIWPDPRIQSLRAVTTHTLGLAAVLHIAESLGTLPETVVIYAISVQDARPLMAISPPLAAEVPALVLAIENELKALVGRASPHA